MSKKAAPADSTARSPLVCCEFLQGKCVGAAAVTCRYAHRADDPAPCQRLDGCPFGHERRLWQRNEDAASCAVCGGVFDAWRWRHHCRRCGRVVDWDCLVAADGPDGLKTCRNCVGKWEPAPPAAMAAPQKQPPHPAPDGHGDAAPAGPRGSGPLRPALSSVVGGSHWSQAMQHGASPPHGAAAVAAAAAPSLPPGGAAADAGLRCAACGKARPPAAYSGAQLKKDAATRRCAACVKHNRQATPPVAAPAPHVDPSAPPAAATADPAPPLLARASSSPGAARCPLGYNVLFIGNSYTYQHDLPGMVRELLRDSTGSGGRGGGCPLAATAMLAAGGRACRDHLADPATVATLRRGNADPEAVAAAGLAAPAASDGAAAAATGRKSGGGAAVPWTHVVLQEQSLLGALGGSRCGDLAKRVVDDTGGRAVPVFVATPPHAPGSDAYDR